MDEPNYYERVYALVATVPAGRVVTYGQVARALGVNRGARAVGYALRALSDTNGVPWWRVVNARGGISPRGEGHGAEIQREMLEGEGVEFGLAGTVDLKRYGSLFAPSADKVAFSTRPLPYGRGSESLSSVRPITEG